MNVAILGSSGFIGSSLAINLIKENKHNLILSSRSRPDYLTDRAKIITDELFSKESFDTALENTDIAYYFLSSSSPKSSWENPSIEADLTIKRFVNFVDAVGSSSVKKIVLASSAGSVYGETNCTCAEQDPLKPFSPYGIGKQAEESFCYFLSKKYNKYFDIYRISNPYGPRQEINNKGIGVISIWLQNILDEKPITIHNGGSVHKDYIYIDDLVTILKISLQDKVNRSNLYNACQGESVSLNYILDTIRDITGDSFRSQIIQKNSATSDNLKVSISNKKIKEKLNHPDFKNINKGVEAFWNYLKSQNSKK